MGFIGGLRAPKRIWGPAIFISKFKFSWCKQPTGKIWMKIYCAILFRGNDLKNNDFDFVDRVIKTPYLFSFRSVKFHSVEETHMMLAAFLRSWNLLQHLGKNDNETNLCRDLLTIENTDSDLKVHELRYANELLVRVRPSFQKLFQTRQTSRNNKKPSKQVLVMIKHCLRNSQINSTPE